MPIDFKPTGLTNVGNTCYMNSVLQALLSSTYLNTYLMRYLEGCVSHKININEYFSPMIIEYLRVVANVYNNNNTYTPISFKRTLDMKLPDFNDYRQHDAQEFLLAIMNEFIDSSKDKNIGNIINKVCAGKNRQLLTCTKCYHIKWDKFKFFEITLPIPTKEDMVEYSHTQYNSNIGPNHSLHTVNMEHCFEKYGKREFLFGMNQWFCPVCKKKVDAIKKEEIVEVPDLTIITFARFSQKEINGKTIVLKNSTPINIYENINLEGKRLRLIATVNHSGSVDGGHYTARIKRNNNWFIANDTSMYPTTINNVVSDPSIYLAFYQAIY